MTQAAHTFQVKQHFVIVEVEVVGPSRVLQVLELRMVHLGGVSNIPELWANRWHTQLNYSACVRLTIG